MSMAMHGDAYLSFIVKGNCEPAGTTARAHQNTRQKQLHSREHPAPEATRATRSAKVNRPAHKTTHHVHGDVHLGSVHAHV